MVGSGRLLKGAVCALFDSSPGVCIQVPGGPNWLSGGACVLPRRPVHSNGLTHPTPPPPIVEKQILGAILGHRKLKLMVRDKILAMLSNLHFLNIFCEQKRYLDQHWDERDARTCQAFGLEPLRLSPPAPQQMAFRTIKTSLSGPLTTQES